MSENKTIGYYQSDIKTSRNEDSVYAMRYASQQMLIDKLQQENQQLKEKNELEFNDFIKYKKEQEDRHLSETNKLIKENCHLKQENKILKENAKHNDKVVDKVNWDNRLLKQALINIREMCNSNTVEFDDDDYCGVDCCVDGFKVLEEIDKVLGDDING